MAKNSPRGRKSLAADKAANGVAAGHATNTAHRASELERLEVFIGRWITEGETTASTEAPSMQIVASDVYQWAPGGHFLIHSAYGRIGEVAVGGLEVIGFYSRQAGTEHTSLTAGETSSRKRCPTRMGSGLGKAPTTRCTGVLTEDGKVRTARHERSDDGIHWVPSMYGEAAEDQLGKAARPSNRSVEML